MIPRHWTPVTRDDGEAVGYVAPDGEAFVALDLLGTELGRAGWEDEARDVVVVRGLASVGRSWDWTDDTGTARRVHVVHVRPGAATVRTGHANVVGADGRTFTLELPVDPERFRPA